MLKKLAIVIINYRTSQMTIDCLSSLLPEINHNIMSVVLVDNNSGDGSADVIESWLSDNKHDEIVSLIRSEKNLGFSGGNNLGIRHIEAEYYLLLNSDTLIRPNAISELLETAKNFKKAGIISPRLEWEDATAQQSCFRFHTPFSELISSAKTGVITKLLAKFDVPLPVSDEIIKPQWTSFACVLIRKEVINQVGLMDEGFFLYFEDVDFCRRVWELNWEIVHNPRAHVVHLRGGSSPVKQNVLQRKRLPQYFYASRNRYFYKYYGKTGLIFTNLCWHIGRVISFSREIIEQKNSHICEKQSYDIWINILNPDKLWK